MLFERQCLKKYLSQETEEEAETVERKLKALEDRCELRKLEYVTKEMIAPGLNLMQGRNVILASFC